ncbi:AAA family ATPase [Microbacterium sp. ASV49]|uniref:Nuclease SbcCD subunit C n=1 Tax=Microbacterium candidum TaxID=3041922 RepID=A0ABT7MWU7_9MICO|nr:AAA family ATPase [Microbacterium sp. ASV49]MDL9978913.1 AAA family ATPase [Microbacterium sp. ASV49]
MKLHRLELEGFGPFRERQIVDFDAFADDGLFLLTGRTGAGKSSVLDGVCFALYGSVPRYPDGDKRLRSDHSDPDDASEVVLDFEVSGGRWQITRSPEYERPKRRGDGVTKEGQRAQLDEWVDGGWMARASGPRDVGLALDEVLGLTRDQFLQVILLAQGRFQQFLLAKNDERQALLRTLFGTRRYADYQEALEERRRDADRALGDGGVRLATLLDQVDHLVAVHGLGDADAPGGDDLARNDDVVPAGDVPTDVVGRLAADDRAVARADYRVETAALARDAAKAAADDATAAHIGVQERVKARGARDHSRAALAALEEQAPAIAADRIVLDRAARAEELRDIIAAAERAEGAAAQARVAEEHALARWAAMPAGDGASVGAHGGATDGAPGDAAAHPDPGTLRERAERLTGDIALWTAAQAIEQRLDALRRDVAAAAGAVTAAETTISGIDTDRASTPALLKDLGEQIDGLAADASGVAPAEAALAETEVRLVAARQAETLAATLHSAETRYASAIEAALAAASALASLMRRRLNGHAGELAADLVDGEPCVVCGSLDHPHPAQPDPGAVPVTDGDLADAERAKDAASETERAAAETARAARTAHGEAAARAGGDDVETLGARKVTQTATLAAARSAAEKRIAAVAERDGLVAKDAAAAAEREVAVMRLTDARAQLSAAQTTLTQAEVTVEEARGDAESVAARVAAATALRDAAQSLAAAIDARASRIAELASAIGERDARIAASVFAEPDEAAEPAEADDPDDPAGAVRAAFRDGAVRAALDARIRAHEIAFEGEKARLLELELALAADDGAELDPAASERAAAVARDAWDRAVSAAIEAQQTARSLRDLVGQADAAHAATAELAERAAVVQRLAHTVAGRAPNTHLMTLETFVLAAELEEIVERANLRLSEMSAGRYRLQHTDALARRRTASGLGIEVMDSFTGQARPPQSLSGGETFLASLALALGLAEAVTANAGGIRLDTLFIDEGFGSLDAETLDLAMRTLDELRQGGRTVGIISHVEAMKEQVPAQLRVEATPQGPSRILQGASIPG